MWLMPIGHLLDQWEIYKQFNGMAKPKIINYLDKEVRVMADTIGVKIGVEGEKEFKNALADINMKMKTLGSEMSLVDAKFSKTDKSEKALTARSQVLSKQIQTQKDKISILEKALQNSATSFGENDKRTQTWQQKLNEAKASLLKMEGQLSNVTNATGDFSDELEENSKQANKSASANKNAADIFSSLGSVCSFICCSNKSFKRTN